MTLIPTRRGLLWTAAGAGGVLVVAGGAAVLTESAASAEAAPAYRPWRRWNDPGLRGSPMALAAAGILAANPHDTQPWLFHIGDEAIEVFADTGRHLGAMDPFLREMHIGLGCALENMVLAAPLNGFAAAVEAMPGSLEALRDRGGPVHAATVRLTRVTPPPAADPAYAAIPRRHTNRYPYRRGVALPKAWREALAAVGGASVRLFLFETGAARGACEAAVNDATAAIVGDAAMIGDSDRWLRRTPAEIVKYRSGPTLEAAGLSPVTLALARVFPVSPAAEHKAWLSHTRDDQAASAPLLGIIAVRDRYDRPQALAAGHLWQRLHLSATLAGVAMQPLNQPVEMIDRERQLGRDPAWERRLAKVTGAPDWRPTFCFRAGIATRPAPPSPRRPLGEVSAG